MSGVIVFVFIFVGSIFVGSRAEESCRGKNVVTCSAGAGRMELRSRTEGRGRTGQIKSRGDFTGCRGTAMGGAGRSWVQGHGRGRRSLRIGDRGRRSHRSSSLGWNVRLDLRTGLNFVRVNGRGGNGGRHNL